MHHMQREQSDMDMNGHRPQSPSSVENAPSPSKRPRLEPGHMNGQQLAPNGRGQGQAMAGQPNPALMMQNGISPRGGMNPSQFQAFQQVNPAAQQKPIQVYAQNLALHHSRSVLNNQGMPNGLMNTGVMGNQADLMPMADGQGYQMAGGEFYGANGQLGQVRAGMQTPNGQQGTHALQDYQMQLMLLEQQNKRRLMMARQEQDNMGRPDGQPPMPGQQLPPGTSPQGSRTGASPNPNDQMKRGTPKMPQTGLPGSPSAGDAMAQGRGSPASMSFNGAQLGPDMAGQFFANGMRPPSSNPAFNGAQMGQPGPVGAGNRVASGNWQAQQNQGQPMASQQSPVSQPQPTGTPQERNAMPPPQAPPVAGANTGRTQPSSPQTSGAPPTPQQANKPGPKSKKEPKDGRKVRISVLRLPRPFLSVVFIEHDPSDLLRRRQLPLMRTRLQLLRPKRSIRLRRPPRRRLHPNIRTRSTRAGQMLRPMLHNSQRQLRPLNLLSSILPIRPSSPSMNSLSQMYVTMLVSAIGVAMG